jgi:hypothetical protein
VGFFLTASKETKKNENNIVAGKVTEFLDIRSRERHDTKITKSDLFSNEEIKTKDHKHLEVRIPSQNTESKYVLTFDNSVDRRTKNHLNDTRKFEHLDKKFDFGKSNEIKKTDRNKESILTLNERNCR